MDSAAYINTTTGRREEVRCTLWPRGRPKKKAAPGEHRAAVTRSTKRAECNPVSALFGSGMWGAA